jgi:hypothetical protein
MNPAQEPESTQAQVTSIATEADPVQTQAEMDEAVLQAGDALSAINELTSVVGNASSAYDEITTLANAWEPWEPLLDKLKIFSELVDKVAEVRFSTVKSNRNMVMDALY